MTPSTPPTVAPTSSYGGGPVISFTAATQSFSVPVDGTTIAFSRPDAQFYVVGEAIIYRRDPYLVRLAWSDDIRTNYTMIAYINAIANYSCIAGSPTLPSDLPSGIVQYINAPVAGTAKIVGDSASYALRQGSQATIRVDMTTKAVTITMRLVGTNGAVSRDFGNFSGTGTLNTGNGSISGTWTWPDYTGGPTSGTFSGSLFGSQGREIGLALSIGAVDSQTPAQWYFTASGDVVFKRF